MRIFFLILLILATGTANAELYKWKDAQGNTVYGDTPPHNVKAEIVTPPPLTTYPAPQATPGAAPAARPAPGKDDISYSGLRILSPANDEAVRSNTGEITVQVQTTPSFVADTGHRIRLYLDGREVAVHASTTLTITDVERGTHSLQAELVDTDGRSVVKSSTIQFHALKYTSIRN